MVYCWKLVLQWTENNISSWVSLVDSPDHKRHRKKRGGEPVHGENMTICKTLEA